MYPFNVTSLQSKRRVAASGPLRNDEARLVDNGRAGEWIKGRDEGVKDTGNRPKLGHGLSSVLRSLNYGFCRPGSLSLPKLTCNATLQRAAWISSSKSFAATETCDPSNCRRLVSRFPRI